MKYKDYADDDNFIYKQLSLAVYQSYNNNSSEAIEHLKLFSEQENYFYWTFYF